MSNNGVERPTWVRRFAFQIVLGFTKAFWGLKVTGFEHVPAGGPLIVAANHSSLWDGPLLCLAAGPERYMRFLAKAELFKVPFLGWFLRKAGMIALERHRTDVSAIRAAVSVLSRGGCLALMPEGTRTQGGLPGRAKAGLGFLAMETGAPVVPAHILNTEKALRFHPFEVRFGPALKCETRGAGREAGQAFAQTVMERVYAL